MRSTACASCWPPTRASRTRRWSRCASRGLLRAQRLRGSSGRRDVRAAHGSVRSSQSRTMNQTPTERASRWLAQFGSAVAAPDVAGAAALFHDESYWRDLVSFTGNIKTMEGAAAIGAMLDTAARIRPSCWSLVDEATEVDGAVEACFRFETALSRGIGHLRLKGERCLTLLTTML